MINPNELLYSVDEDNHPIDPQPRKLSHEIGIWHRSCHVWIINTSKEILCQQRSLLKDSNPGRWESFFGGHLAPGQEYSEAALFELQEELGLSVQPDKLHFYTEYRYVPGTEFQGIFTLEWDGAISSLQLEEDEVQQVAWKTIDEIKSEVVRKRNDHWTSMGYEAELLHFLQS